jgi:hypothetical protein
MALLQKTINVGTIANDGTGDNLRQSFQKTNDNFTNLYTEVSKLPTEGLASRDTFGFVTQTINPNETIILNVEAYKGYVLYRIEVDAAVWVRIYANTALRTADESRTIEEDPLPSSGVITEVVSDGPRTIVLAPGVYGFNAENPPTNMIPVRLTSLALEPRQITVTFTVLKMEA